MKRIFSASVVLLVISAGTAFAQVTISYDARVTSASGPHAGVFSAGDRLAISYTLDPGAVDSDSDPDEGLFPGAVLSMSTSFPDLGVFANAGPSSTAQTYNDFASPLGRTIDIVFIHGGPLASSSTLGGEAMTETFAEFSQSLQPPAVASMLPTDALPLFSLPANYTFVAIRTGSGFTYVHFALASQPVFTYNAVVTGASGPHAALFPAGETIKVSYALDSTATDSNPDTIRGVIYDAVLALSVSFPGLGIFADAETPELAQTFNNVAEPSGRLSDQVFIHGGRILSSSTLGGEAISQIEVDFLSDLFTPPLEPTMISSDALPLFRLPLIDSFAVFRTSSGTTFVNFALPPQEAIQTLIGEVEGLEASGDITSGEADWLINQLEQAIAKIDRGNPRSACSHLRSFIRRVENHVSDGSISPADGHALVGAAERIGIQIGC